MTIMDDLNPKARALIQVSRKALRATSTDRERIETALRARLGPESLPIDGGSAAASSIAGWKAAGIALGVCIAGTAAVVALRPAASVRAPRAPSAPIAAPATQKQSATVEPSLPPPTAANVSAPDTSAPAKEPSLGAGRDKLAREVALLSRAASELSAGRPEEALKALDVHRRRFPNGALREDRQAARARVLCRLGRLREGRAELVRLAPQSPAAARAAEECDAEASRAGREK